MTEGLRKSHLRKAHQVGLSEVGLPDIYLQNVRYAENLQLPGQRREDHPHKH